MGGYTHVFPLGGNVCSICRLTREQIRAEDAPNPAKREPRKLVREWWEIWWIKDGESIHVCGISGRELRFALLADAREYVAMRANQYYRIKRVRRYRVAR